MKRTQVYFEDEKHDKLTRLAHLKGISMAEVVRDYVDKGLRNEKIISDTSGLMELANLAAKEGWSGPADLAKRHIDYFIEAFEEEPSET